MLVGAVAVVAVAVVVDTPCFDPRVRMMKFVFHFLFLRVRWWGSLGFWEEFSQELAWLLQM